MKKFVRAEVIFSFLLIGLSSCDTLFGERLANPPAQFDHEDLGYIPLQARVVSTGEFLGLPNDILVLGSNLLIADYPSSSAVHLIRSDDGQRLLSFGREGSGPGEFESHPRLLETVSPNDSSFWAFDVNLARLTKYYLPSLLAKESDSDELMRLPGDQFVYDFRLLSDSTAAGLGFFQSGRLALIDFAHERIDIRGPLPSDANAPASVLQHAYQSELATNPTRTRIAVATRRGSQIEIYDSRGNLINVTDGPYEFEVDFDIIVESDGPHFSAGRLNRYGYIDVYGTEEYLIGLFSGRSEEAYRNDAWLAEYLHVFDWNGRFIKAYRLDRPVTDFTLDRKRSFLYAITTHPQPTVLEYELSLDVEAPDSGVILTRDFDK